MPEEAAGRRHARGRGRLSRSGRSTDLTPDATTAPFGPPGDPGPRSEPERTCVGCRQVAGRAALLRVVAEGGDDGQLRVVPDPRRRRPGRGAWLHPDPACLDLAVRRKAFGRAFKTQVSVDASVLQAWVQAVLAEDDERVQERRADDRRPDEAAPSENRKRV